MIQPTTNPFARRASDRLLRRGHRGGQHAASVGSSTRDPVPLPWDKPIFDVNDAPNAEPQVVQNEGVLAQYMAVCRLDQERQRDA